LNPPVIFRKRACASLTIAARMIAMLESAAFDHAHINEDEARDLIQAADTLIESVP